MEQIGRPSEIYRTLREARCATCGDWIRAPLFRLHRESAHPTALEQRGGELREIPIPVRIAEWVAIGVKLDAAAGAVGVGRRTVDRWMAIGRRLEEEYGPDADALEIPAERRIFWQFWQEIDRARDAARARHHRIVERSAEAGDWKAAAWLLERTAPDDYGRVDRLRVGGDTDAGPVRVVHEEADPNFVEEVTRIYRDAGVVPDVDSAHNSTNGHSPKED